MTDSDHAKSQKPRLRDRVFDIPGSGEYEVTNVHYKASNVCSLCKMEETGLLLLTPVDKSGEPFFLCDDCFGNVRAHGFE